MSSIKVLVVDDEARMRRLIKDFLSAKGYTILEAGDGEEAIDIFMSDKGINLIILDVMMPKLDGWATCSEIRSMSNVPIIMLTAKGDERDELLGFKLGVDEYISKPFSPKILVARVEALLKRSKSNEVQSAVFGVLEYNKIGNEVKVLGQEIELTLKEFELLTYFIENEGIALTRDNILNNVWNFDYLGDGRTIDTHVKRLRSKLGQAGDYIKTVWGLGYKFEVGK
ncbi:MAG: DNA-binding response regulator [Clostridiales bacterium]|jgi:DNA-binding response OmpR family regulator|nr:DNA-binding response regulator [Clostridiales bacterium]